MMFQSIEEFDDSAHILYTMTSIIFMACYSMEHCNFKVASLETERVERRIVGASPVVSFPIDVFVFRIFDFSFPIFSFTFFILNMIEFTN